MWPFKKQRDAQIVEPSNHKWSIGETTDNGQPFFIRFNTTAKDLCYKDAFPIRVGFAIPLRASSGLGLPEDDETDELRVIEHLICDLVYKKSSGILVLVLTNDGVREYIFYVEPNTDIKTIHEHLLSNVKTHEVQCMAVKDPDWDIYNEYTPS